MRSELPRATMEFYMVRLFLRMACHCACVLLLIHAPMAASEELAPALTLQDAVTRSLERNLDLKAFAYESVAQAARVQQARARPSPEVGLLVENVAGSGRRSSFDQTETTLSLGVLIEHGARQRRIDAAQAGGTLVDVEQRILRLDVAAEAARRFVTVLSAQEILSAAQRATQLAEQTADAVQQRVRAAKAPQAEEARAHAQLARARLNEKHAEHELAFARQRLAALWGSTQPDFGNARGDLLELPALESFEAVRARLDKNVELDRLVSEKRLRETELRLAEMRRRLPWHVTAGVRRFEDGSDHAFVVGMTVPIASRDYAQGAIDEARAQSSKVDAASTAFRVQLDAELFGIYQDLRHAYEEVQTLRSDVLPSVEAALEQTRYAYERGRYGYVEWAAAQSELAELRRALVEASANAHRQRIEIERLTGTALGGRIIE
jgi:cobalt-zinc-cadmium efflux system outer membrane protein